MNLSFHSTVVYGAQLGRMLGFPTANLEKGPEGLEFGVYAVQVKIQEGIFLGAANWGPKPSAGLLEPVFEVHVLDFSGDLYGQELEIFVLEKIREVQKFTSLDELKAQIARDLEAVRKMQV
jgi:riboflavin kinase/FMN adenylyltransferase